MTDAVDRALAENHSLIAAILEHHANNRQLPTVALLERLQINLEFVAAVAEHGVPIPQAPIPHFQQQQQQHIVHAVTSTHPPHTVVPLAPAPHPQHPPTVASSQPHPVSSSAPQQQHQQHQQQTAFCWTADEHARFEQAMRVHGHTGKDGKPDINAIATVVGSRTPAQVRSHLETLHNKHRQRADPDPSQQQVQNK